MGRKKKISRTLEQQPRRRRPKFVMPSPNDDIDAYGWALKNIRLPTDEKDIAGRPIFNIKVGVENIRRYGTDVQFLCPTYLEVFFDNCPQVSAAVQKARDAGWAPEQVNKITAAIVRTFDEKILVDMAQRFHRVAPMVAQFYAARAAHRDMYGDEEADDEPETKSTPE